jgi:hypothetical protein
VITVQKALVALRKEFEQPMPPPRIPPEEKKRRVRKKRKTKGKAHKPRGSHKEVGPRHHATRRKIADD